MDIKLDINAAQINDMVSKAVIESAIGDALKASIDDQVKKLSRGWDSPFDGVVRKEIEAACFRVLREEYSEQIESVVKEKLAAYITGDFIGEVMMAALEKMRD